MFTAALFAITKIWKRLKCSSVGRWIEKMWYVYTMEYYFAIKKNEIFMTAWMYLEGITLSETNQTKTNTIGSLTYMWNLKKSNNTNK